MSLRTYYHPLAIFLLSNNYIAFIWDCKEILKVIFRYIFIILISIYIYIKNPHKLALLTYGDFHSSQRYYFILQPSTCLYINFSSHAQLFLMGIQNRLNHVLDELFYLNRRTSHISGRLHGFLQFFQGKIKLWISSNKL